MLMTETGPLIR